MDAKVTKKLSRKEWKALKLADLQVAEQQKIDVAKTEAAIIKTAMEDLNRRLTVVEKRAGVPGPKGDKGEKGSGFWG